MASVAFLLNELMQMIERYMPPEEIQRVHAAFKLAEKAHDGVIRKSGDLYITHPLSVAIIVADMRMDSDTIMAALLHDVVEDTDYTLDDIQAHFGEVVQHLVDGVTKLDQSNFASKSDAVIASFRNMMECFTEDYRVVLIKLADRLHNLRTLGAMRADKRRRIAKETFAVYVPLARRMGVNVIRREMQLLAFQNMSPWRSRIMQTSLDNYLSENADKHATIVKRLSDNLRSIPGANVFPAKKNLYRIYEQAKREGQQFNELREWLEIRIVVGTRASCYQALGLVHETYKPKVDGFTDFIASPRSYGYQALRTLVLTRTRIPVLIQIQTRDMYHVSQYGITAQWRYPDLSDNNSEKVAQAAMERWSSQVKELAAKADNPDEFYADMQVDFFTTELYAFTPKGDIKEFPPDATLLDFAFAIHTEVGLRAIAAKVDGVEQPLRMRIPNGATIEIKAGKTEAPQEQWLNCIVTARARSAIRSWFRQRDADGRRMVGRKLLERELRKYSIPVEKLEDTQWQKLFVALGVDSQEAVFEAIAKGEHGAQLIMRRLLGDEALKPAQEDTPILLKGAEDLLVSIQPCCYPVPNESISAVLGKEEGLMVHREDCSVLQAHKPSSVIPVSWGEQVHDASHLVAIQTQAHNVVGVLRYITSTLEKMNANIEDIVTGGDKYIKDTNLVIRVRDITHLKNIIRQLEHNTNIISVKRLTQSRN